jgi:E3 ubiquitin-protein ligase HERC2
MWFVFNIFKGLDVTRIFCGSEFCLALCRNGALYTWGKGDHYRLGHGTDDPVR